MSKVLFVLPMGLDMGGIITSAREMCAGIQAAGHEVQFITAQFTSTDRPVGPRARGKYESAFVWDNATQASYHPMLGWREEPRVTLATESGVQRFLDIVKKYSYDIVIWGAIFPFADQDASIWLPAFKRLKAKQVIMIHDDHLVERYPWALALAKYVGCYVGMFNAAYDSLQSVASSRTLVYNPTAPLPRELVPYDKRKGFFNCQVWKPWKNADKLVGAAAWMPRRSVTFAGDGIQLRYIRSLDKCPPKFVGMWDEIMGADPAHKQTYVGVLKEDDRTLALQQHRFLVDLSYRPNNTGQINTMVQQAMAQGCVVVANPEFLGTSPFRPMVEYVPILRDQYGPEDLARELKRIDKEISGERYEKIQKAAWRRMGLFERKRIGQQIVDAALAGRTYPPTRWQSDAFNTQFGVRP